MCLTRRSCDLNEILWCQPTNHEAMMVGGSFREEALPHWDTSHVDLVAIDRFFHVSNVFSQQTCQLSVCCEGAKHCFKYVHGCMRPPAKWTQGASGSMVGTRRWKQWWLVVVRMCESGELRQTCNPTKEKSRFSSLHFVAHRNVKVL